MAFFPHSKFEQSSITDIEPLDISKSSSDTSTFSSVDEGMLLAVDCPKHRAGRKKFKETRHSVYRGVRGRKNDKWVAEIREQNSKTRIWLGTYPTAVMAARAHDVAVLALRGKSACLNFADSVWRLPVPRSATAKDIRKTATEAAEIFRVLSLKVIIEPEIVTVSVEIYPKSKIIEPEIVTTSVENFRIRKTILPEVVDMAIPTEPMFYIEDEVEFGFPGMFANMAQGLLLAPPPSIGFHLDDLECYGDISLWS